MEGIFRRDNCKIVVIVVIVVIALFEGNEDNVENTENDKIMKKIYEVKGMMEWHPVFRVGRVRLKVSFTGGHLCGGAVTAASYETSDPVVQTVIESSAAYRSGRIKCRCGGQCVGPASPPAKTEAPAPAPSAGWEARDSIPATIPAMMTMEFDNLDKATDFLSHHKGIPIEQMLSVEDCRAKARCFGIDVIIKSNQ